MIGSLGFTICGLIFLSLTAVFYFVKKRYKTLENDIFTVLLVFTFFLLLLEVVCVFSMSMRNIFPLLNEILCRGYILGVIIWMSIILTYLWCLGKNLKYEKNIYIFKEPFVIFLTLVALVIFIFSLFYGLSYTSGYNNELYVIGGKGVSILYVYFFLLTIYILYVIVYKKRNTPIFKRLPLFVFLLYLLLTTILQFATFDFNDLTYIFCFCVIAMYFSLENPDLQLIEELKKANNEAEIADKEKTEFLSNMSHEIRTPLNAIVGFSQSIITGNDLDNEAIKKDLSSIYSASLNLMEIVDNILDISLIEDGKEEVNNEPYSVIDILSEINNFVNKKISKDVKYEYSISKNLPKVVIGDREKVYKILNGLISNSIKFTKSGKIKLDVISDIVDDEVIMKFIISDTGIGIKEKDFDKLFTKFNKINKDSEINLINNSTGLGLAIVKDLVQLLDGEISFQSSYGVGTTFEVVLKNKIENKELVGDIEIEYNDYETIDCSKHKVLLVDDEDVSREESYSLLKKYNFDISCCNSAIEGIEKIKNGNKYDMLIINRSLSKMDAIEVLSIIKKLDDCYIPRVLVVVSNRKSDEDKNICLENGFNEYLSKPLESVDVGKLVDRFFLKEKEGSKDV